MRNGDTVYVFGGEGVVVDDEDVYLKEDQGDVQCFDTGTNRWHRISFIPCGGMLICASIIA